MPPPVVRQSGDAEAALPVVELCSGLVDALHDAPAARCRDVLRSAGLLVEVTPSKDPDDPLGWIQAVQDLLYELTVLEDHRDGLVCMDDRVMIRDAPLWAWGLPPLLPVLGLCLAGMVSSEAMQILTLFFTIVVPIALWVVGVVVAYRIARGRRHARHEDLKVTKARIIQTRASLIEGASSTLARDFVARTGDRLVVCTPSLAGADGARVQAWLEAREAYQIDPPARWIDLDFSCPPAQP